MSTVPISSADTRWSASPGLLSRFNLATVRRILFPPSLGLAFSLAGLFVVLFQVLRVCMVIRNRDMVDGAGFPTLATAFLVGMRFDMATAGYVTIPLLLLSRLGLLMWGSSGERRVYTIGALTIGIILLVLGLGELEFFREFFSRYNTLAIEFWGEPGTVCSMIWHGYPVVRYLLLAAVFALAYCCAVFRLTKFWMPQAAAGKLSSRLVNLLPVVLGVAILVLAARGGPRRVPLQWGDAVFSDSTFANQLAQNGFWSLGRGAVSLISHEHGDANHWGDSLASDEARSRAQRMLLLPHEELTGDNSRFPLLKRVRDEGNRSLRLNPISDQPPNVVLIIMESFSGRFVGALGSDNDRTPEFNRLASQGILFDRCFSNGSHTHQANYACAACFPNLPGYEFLMQSAVADQKFDSLPRAFKQRGYQTMFIYNGDFAWDNIYGFFKIQGIDRFIGRDDFDSSAYRDATWGVSDRELFERVNEEFAKVKKPFYATVLTLSNHPPFNLPKPLPFPEVTDSGERNTRMNGIRFADWSIGHFFELARKESYFANTIFVMVGDHSINLPPLIPVLTELHILRFHVPLLFYAPELLGNEDYPRHTVASQVDIGPTILGLVGDHSPHQHWGRDLFALPDGDPGFAIFKPSSNEDSEGLARDDTLLVRDKSGVKTLYKYDLGFPAKAVPLNDSDGSLMHEMDRDMRAYIQTALEVLTSRSALPTLSPSGRAPE